jgi:succinylglutamate desuccinylase
MKSPAPDVAANVGTMAATSVATEITAEVGIEASVLALAGADFSVLARRFCTAGFAVVLPAPGMLQITHPDASSTVALGGALRRARVLVSVGIHGDETAPIEVLAHVLDALSHQPDLLALDLMVCVGNLDAIHAGRRFIDADLNRMFRPVRGALAGSAEAARADALIAATLEFFGEAEANGAAEGAVNAEIKDNAVLRWHLDLHTAIRSSLYPTFAIVPELIAADAKTALAGWLGQAGVEAIVLNPTSAGTYSHFSAQHCGCASATVELGRVGVLGQNDLHLFAPVALALAHLLKGSPEGVNAADSTDSADSARPASWPVVYTVAQQIIKRSAAFSMAFDAGTPNFTALPGGSIIATDGETVHRVGAADEMVVFPNPDVQIGLRAALMVRR